MTTPYFNPHEYDCWLTGAQPQVQHFDKRKLTHSERRALDLYLDGLEYLDIAKRMKIHVSSVRTYIGNAKAKMGI